MSQKRPLLSPYVIEGRIEAVKEAIRHLEETWHADTRQTVAMHYVVKDLTRLRKDYERKMERHKQKAGEA